MFRVPILDITQSLCRHDNHTAIHISSTEGFTLIHQPDQVPSNETRDRSRYGAMPHGNVRGSKHASSKRKESSTATHSNDTTIDLVQDDNSFRDDNVTRKKGRNEYSASQKELVMSLLLQTDSELRTAGLKKDNGQFNWAAIRQHPQIQGTFSALYSKDDIKNLYNQMNINRLSGSITNGATNVATATRQATFQTDIISALQRSQSNALLINGSGVSFASNNTQASGRSISINYTDGIANSALTSLQTNVSLEAANNQSSILNYASNSISNENLTSLVNLTTSEVQMEIEDHTVVMPTTANTTPGLLSEPVDRNTFSAILTTSPKFSFNLNSSFSMDEIRAVQFPQPTGHLAKYSDDESDLIMAVYHHFKLQCRKGTSINWPHLIQKYRYQAQKISLENPHRFTFYKRDEVALINWAKKKIQRNK